MSQEVKTGKILSPSTPWTARGVPGIQTPDEQQSLKAIFTEPTIECPDRKSTRLNSSHLKLSRMPSSA